MTMLVLRAMAKALFLTVLLEEAAAAALYAAFGRQMPFAPICFARSSILPPSGVIQGLTPSLADPFYNLSDWKIKFS